MSLSCCWEEKGGGSFKYPWWLLPAFAAAGGGGGRGLKGDCRLYILRIQGNKDTFSSSASPLDENSKKSVLFAVVYEAHSPAAVL